jgi:hypothetical protein
MALLRLRWSIVDDELLEVENSRKAPAGGSTRSRLRVVS